MNLFSLSFISYLLLVELNKAIAMNSCTFFIYVMLKYAVDRMFNNALFRMIPFCQTASSIYISFLTSACLTFFIFLSYFTLQRLNALPLSMIFWCTPGCNNLNDSLTSIQPKSNLHMHLHNSYISLLATEINISIA